MNDVSNPGANGTWRNWSGLHAAPAATWCMPHDEDDLREVVRSASHLRVTGAGHSFTPLVPTDGMLVSLDHLSGVVDHDAASECSTLWAGTRLHQLGPLLHGLGQALPNMGDIDHQSLAGVLSTATHGTGVELPCIAAGALSLRLVDARGEVLECSRERDAELFRAAAVSLGAMGVITQAKMQNCPSYRLHEKVWVVPLQQAFAELDSLRRAHRNFEFWAFPFGGQAIVKTLDITDESPTAETEGADSQDGILRLCSELTRLTGGRLTPALQRLVARFVRPTERVNWWHKIYPSARNVRFHEMEYHVPAENGPACMEEVCRVQAASGQAVFFPIEYRYVSADDYMLSPFGGGPRASIAVHQYYKQDYRPLFDQIEPILRRHGGRPHWGKLHSLGAADLHALYPELGSFLRLRAELDPKGKFLNPYLRSLFGLGAA